MGWGVGKAGSPAVKSSTGLPALASALALAANASVGDPSTWRRRSARVTAIIPSTPSAAWKDGGESRRGAPLLLFVPELSQTLKELGPLLTLCGLAFLRFGLRGCCRLSAGRRLC